MANELKVRQFMSKHGEVDNRRTAIVRFLKEAKHAVQSSEIKTWMDDHSGLEHGYYPVNQRTIQRDLETLLNHGYVAYDRTLGGWRAAEHQPDPELKDFTSMLAFEVFEQVLDVAVPLEMRSEIRSALKFLRRKSKPAEKTKYERWLDSIRIVPSLHVFTAPQIDRGIRLTIEQAILEKRKVRIRVTDGEFGDWPQGERSVEVVSISHCLVKLPDRPTLVVWRDDDKGVPRPNHQPTCYFVMMERIDSAELMDEAATWPPYTPSIPSPDSSTTESGKETFVFRASPYLLQLWIGTWVRMHMEILGVDDQGWSTCRVEVPGWAPSEWGNNGDDFVEFMNQYPKDLEIISPFGARMRARGMFLDAAGRYRSERQLPKEVMRRLITEDRQLDDESLRDLERLWKQQNKGEGF